MTKLVKILAVGGSSAAVVGGAGAGIGVAVSHKKDSENQKAAAVTAQAKAEAAQKAAEQAKEAAIIAKQDLNFKKDARDAFEAAKEDFFVDFSAKVAKVLIPTTSAPILEEVSKNLLTTSTEERLIEVEKLADQSVATTLAAKRLIPVTAEVREQRSMSEIYLSILSIQDETLFNKLDAEWKAVSNEAELEVLYQEVVSYTEK